jgi:hypothetical protein
VGCRHPATSWNQNGCPSDNEERKKKKVRRAHAINPTVIIAYVSVKRSVTSYLRDFVLSDGHCRGIRDYVHEGTQHGYGSRSKTSSVQTKDERSSNALTKVQNTRKRG